MIPTFSIQVGVDICFRLDHSDFTFQILQTCSIPQLVPWTLVNLELSWSIPSDFSVDAQTPSGFPPENVAEKLEVIAEPFYGKKLRYRKDYDKYKNRLGSMKNRTKDSSYQGPAIRVGRPSLPSNTNSHVFVQIPRSFLTAQEQHFVRVSLVTVRHPGTDCQYIHPYELENASNLQYNDQTNNVVWFPIQGEELNTGIKR